jgi:hypothetical protein
MANVWIKRGIGHKLGLTGLGRPAYKFCTATSFWNRKLADNATVVVDSNNYATKVAHQARYSTTSSPVRGFFDAPFNINLNTTQFSTPLWTVPASYPTRKVYFRDSGLTNRLGASVVYTSGSPVVTGVTSTVADGTLVFSSHTPEGTRVATGGGGTGTITLDHNAVDSATAGLYSVLSDSFVVGLQGLFDAVPVPLLADMPAWWNGKWGTRLWAGSSDAAMSIYQPSTDTMWEMFSTAGSEATGYSAGYGGVIQNVSTSTGILPNTWGRKASSLMSIGGAIMAQEWNDGVIPHALSLALPVTLNAHLPPATRHDSAANVPGSDNRDAVPEGAIFRLPANIYIDPAWSTFLTLVVKAVRDYGLVVTDTSGVVQMDAEDPRTVGTMFSPTIPGDYSSTGSFLNGVNSHDLQLFPWESLVQIAYP